MDELQVATLSGGCFWCTEAIFKRLNGVVKITSGYSGGEMANPTYDDVSSGQTGHAEAIQIEFDPTVITYGHLLDIFWATHDPTSINRQGNDVGTQYRSVIFYHNDLQKEVALASKDKAQKEESFGRSIVTEVMPFKNFYPAEDYQQNYYETNKATNSYCSLVIDPKIAKLIEKFNSDVKQDYK